MDYRKCEYEGFSYKTILSAKDSLEVQIDLKARTQRGRHFKKIRDKKGKYYQPFEQIYHAKCAYCGIITAIQPSASFEVDHFINELQKTLPNGKSVDHVSNLVFSCGNCNQSKKQFHVNNATNELNPDTGIHNVFSREKNYAIKIKNEFKGNQDIEKFYNKLKFSSSFRKLDYLLLNLFYLKDSTSKSEVNNSLLRLYTDLLTLRNKQPSLSKIGLSD